MIAEKQDAKKTEKNSTMWFVPNAGVKPKFRSNRLKVKKSIAKNVTQNIMHKKIPVLNGDFSSFLLTHYA